MTIEKEAIIEALRPVEDPELHRSIVDLGMVKSVAINESTVAIDISLTTAGCPMRSEIDRRVKKAVGDLDGVEVVELEFSVMTEQQLAELRTKLQGGAPSGHEHIDGASHNHAPQRTVPFTDPANKTRVLLIASGKGGVGKSSVTSNLAVALANRGHKVGVIDADVWGFSIPRMIGVQEPPKVEDEMLIPPKANGVSVISMGFFAEEDQAVIWRGPMLHKALEQFLTDVQWDEPDFLLIDLPPGTGDISISLAGFLPRAEVYVVTTPQPVAQKVAQRAAVMAKQVNLEVKGVIENMSWFTGDDGKRYELFGKGGGAELAETTETPLLGQIPFLPQMREGADFGRPIAAIEPDSEAGLAFSAIAERIDVELAPTRRYHSELKIN